MRELVPVIGILIGIKSTRGNMQRGSGIGTLFKHRLLELPSLEAAAGNVRQTGTAHEDVQRPVDLIETAVRTQVNSGERRAAMECQSAHIGH